MSPTVEERFAEWYVWAKREVSSEGRVCLGAAQAAIEALEAGGSEQAARLAARRSVAGQAVVLLARVPPRRRAYAEWYDWARRELRCEPGRLHAATRAAIECLDRGGSVDEAVAAARTAAEAARATAPAAPVAVEPTTSARAVTPAQPGLATGPPWTPPASVRPAPTPPAPAPASPAPAPASPAPAPVPAAWAQPPGGWPAAAQALPAIVSPAVEAQAQAGFWRRLVAFVIDAVLVTIGVALVFVVISIFYGIALLSSPGPDQSAGVTLAMLVIVLVLLWLYWAGLESSPWQGTIGKRALDLVVTDLQGRRISFGRATGRYFAKLISNFTLGLGYVMVSFSDQKQGLHDMIAGTLVVRRRYLSPVKPRQQPRTQGQPAAAGEVQRV
ncbi:MAG TPA: RDD family protein [Candidatus Dormibacteraeota bacterium]|nr:RDD family protein [Candidatus Dormibacteraeota bacterium]